jgi:hypothetical protein
MVATGDSGRLREDVGIIREELVCSCWGAVTVDQRSRLIVSRVTEQGLWKL